MYIGIIKIGGLLVKKIMVFDIGGSAVKWSVIKKNGDFVKGNLQI